MTISFSLFSLQSWGYIQNTLFSLQLANGPNKLERLLLAGVFSLVKCLEVWPEPAQLKHLSGVLNSRLGSGPYPQTLD